MSLPLLCEDDCVPARQFERAVVAQHPFLKSTAMAICHDQIEADDLVQEAMVKALVNRRRFRAGSNLRAWLNCIMRNSFINNCRRRSRECLTDFTIPTCEAIQSMPAPQEMQLYAQEVGKALAQLPTDQRDALLEVSSGARYHLVARASGCEVGTVKSRVSRARSKLLASLGESPGVSQTLLEAAITQPRPVFSCFVNLLQSEEARKQIILVIDGPAA